MHYFIYQADRHHRSYRYPPLSTTTIRGDFNLDTMRTGLKGRYTIHGFTTHPFHKLLKQMDLQVLMNGHIIEVPDAKHAIWLKLNYDQIGKGKTTYLGSYKNIKVEDLEALASEHAEITRNLKLIQADYYTLHTFSTSLQGFAHRRPLYEGSPISDKMILDSKDLHQQLITAVNVSNTQSSELRSRLLQITETVKSYLKDHEM